MENNAFKGSLFGGFNRQDVMNYIEKSARESAELIQQDQERIAALEQEAAELRETREQLQAQLDEMTAAHQSASQALAALQEAHTAAEEARTAAEEANERYEAELRALKDTVAALQPEVDDFHKLKNNIAEVEVEAHHRADTIIADATAQAEALLKKAQEEADALTGEATARAEKTVAEANMSAAALRQKADQHAMLTRQQLSVLLTNCRGQYERMIENYKSAALQAATALQKAQENMTVLPSVFDKIDEGIAKMTEQNQKKD